MFNGFLIGFGAVCFCGGIMIPQLVAVVLLLPGVVCLLNGVGRLSSRNP